MVTSLAPETNNIIRITNLLNGCHTYTTYKEGDSQTLSNYEIFKSIVKDAVKYNRNKIHIYLNINNLHFKPSLKPKKFEDISEDPFPIS